MKENLGGAILRVGVFLAVCALGLVAMLAVFGASCTTTQRPVFCTLATIVRTA